MRYLILIILLTPFTVMAQFGITASTGYGFYSMSGLKDFQEQIKKQFPVDAKITDSYPAFPYFEASASQRVNDGLIVGGSFTYGSTGGRIYYSDYSGMLGSDQLLTFYALSATLGTSIKLISETMILVADLRPGVVVTDFKLTFDQAIGNQTDKESMKFQSVNISIQPTFSMIKRFGYFGVHATAGYNVTAIPGKLFSKDQNDAYLVNDKQKPIYSDWSGLRIAAGIIIYFRNVAKTEITDSN